MDNEGAGFAGALRSLVRGVRDQLRPNPGTEAPTSPRLRVLCVDDNADLLALLQRHLKADYEVITAPDGESALAMLKGGARFDAIISDLQMPGIYGVTFLHEAKSIAPNTPTIILTGRNDPITLATARKSSGAKWILFKPYSKQELLEALRDATQQPRNGTSGAPGADGT